MGNCGEFDVACQDLTVQVAPPECTRPEKTLNIRWEMCDAFFQMPFQSHSDCEIGATDVTEGRCNCDETYFFCDSLPPSPNSTQCTTPEKTLDIMTDICVAFFKEHRHFTSGADCDLHAKHVSQQMCNCHEIHDWCQRIPLP